MPSHYTHYQFGKELIKRMPVEIKNIIDADINCLNSYVLGLQGPDPLYFSNPWIHPTLRKEAYKIHHSSGNEFFTGACAYVERTGIKAAASYLIGSIAHYMLDSACHPSIIKYQHKLGITHQRVERELDNYIISSNGGDPLYLDLNFVIPRNYEVGGLCAPFYRTTCRATMNEAINRMRRSLSLMQADSVLVRKAEYGLLSATASGKKKRDMIIREDDRNRSDDEYLSRNRSIIKIMEGIIDETVLLIRDTLDSIANGKNLNERFLPDYLGRIH